MRRLARILVFVLSEASPELIRRWAGEGKLPFFARMMRSGSAGELCSQVPFVTAQSFADIYTGRRGQEHGIFDFVQRNEQGRFKEVTRESIRCTTIWDLIEQAGKTCAFVNLPLTWPPRSVNGYMISGQDSPVADRRIAAPPALYDALTAKLGRYHLKDIFPGGRSKQDYLELLAREIDWQSDLLAELIGAHACDYFMTFFSATAMAQHYFWTEMEQARKDDPYAGLIERVYARLDAQLARLSKLAGPEARIFVISECGAGPLKYGVNVNAWLHEHGFLQYRPPSRGTRYRVDVLETLLMSAKRYLPEAIKSYLARRHPGLKAGAEDHLAVADIDWTTTTAYSRGKEGAIFVNLAGREAQGIVEPGPQYEEVVGRIIDELSRLTDPDTGQPVTSKVHRREGLYPGCRHPGAPDLIIEWVDGQYMPMEAQRSRQQIFGPRFRASMRWPTSGSHRINGIFFANGPGIAAGHRVTGAGTLDLLPTWLRMLGVTPPADLPGRVLEFCCRDPAPAGEVSA